MEHIGLKTTRLRSLGGEQLILGNSDVINTRIRNLGRMEDRRGALKVGVTYDTPRDLLAQIPGWIEEIVAAQEETRFDRCHLSGFADSAIEFDTVFYMTVPSTPGSWTRSRRCCSRSTNGSTGTASSSRTRHRSSTRSPRLVDKNPLESIVWAAVAAGFGPAAHGFGTHTVSLPFRQDLRVRHARGVTSAGTRPASQSTRMDTTDFSFHTSPIMLLSGTANPALAQGIADVLGERLCDVTIKRFADGEIFVRIDENVRGRDVFLIQPTNPPAENVLELLILLDAAKRASAARVTAVVPYYGYGRSDRKDQPRVSIAAKLLANLMTAAGADRVLSIDFHQHQIQGFFDIPVDHLYAAPVFRRYYEMKKLDNLVVVATDVSAAKMARGYARRLGGDLAIIDKRRPAPNEAEVSNIVGEVEGKHCIVPDDMIDTAGTMVSAIEVLKERGALDIYVLATHPLFSGRRWSASRWPT